MTDLIKEMEQLRRELIDTHPAPFSLKSKCAVVMHKAIEALREQEWQPIETAPKDGRHILGWFGKGSFGPYAEEIFFDVQDNSWRWAQDSDEINIKTLTHWRPLPAPPAKEQDDE